VFNSHFSRPPLAAPKVVDKTGQAVQPEPEKNFLQRYWLPIVGIMLVFAVLAGPDEPAKGGPRR
jgi:hypothetical protein